MGWAAEEFRTLDLGDGRLDARAVLLAERLAGKPTESIPNACSGWAETQGAYRFLSNAKTDWQALLKPHWTCSEERMRAHPVVLNIQDTTELDFNGRATAGLGPLSYEAQRGMYLHPTYAVSPTREPLGVLDAWMWAREAKGKDGKRGGIVESTRWIEGYERVAERALALPQVRQVYVADREADILALLRRAQELQHAADYLIRCRHNRVLPNDGKLWEQVAQAPVLGKVAFELPGGRGTVARPVTQSLRAQVVELSDGKVGTLHVTCLLAQEIDPPAGVKPVVWRLLSNRCHRPPYRSQCVIGM
ncbi:IS4 family transposase [Roseateles sp.]|uniref:IS4 family transposase n=1 Tax=Roseateles sp. TaxID=1971397 RepID=UPI0039E76814